MIRKERVNSTARFLSQLHEDLRSTAVPLDGDQTSRTDSCPHPLGTLEAPFRQRSQRLHLFSQALRASAIELLEQLLQKKRLELRKVCARLLHQRFARRALRRHPFLRYAFLGRGGLCFLFHSRLLSS